MDKLVLSKIYSLSRRSRVRAARIFGRNRHDEKGGKSSEHREHARMLHIVLPVLHGDGVCAVR